VVAVMVVFCTVELTNGREVAKDPLLHYATDTEVVIRKDDGSYKMAYDTADGFRAEVRDAGGVVKGVYGYTGPNGKIITKTYLSDSHGYRLASLSELGVELPPLPYNLHPKAGQRKFPKEEVPEEDVEPASSRQEDEGPMLINYQHPVQIHPFGRFDIGAEAVVIEPAVEGLGRFIDQNDDEDYNDIVLVGEDYDGAIGALAGRPASHPIDTKPVENFEVVGSLPFPIKPGQSVSHIRPSATAIAGEGGMAQAGPGGTAVVGAGGIAVSTPTGNAVVGPGGVAISAPVSTAQAGVGGIAIAGGQAIAIAGVQNPGQQFLGGSGSVLPQAQGDANRPGWEALRSAHEKKWFFNPKSAPAPTLPIEIKASKGSQITAYPIIANYFFNVPQHFFNQAASSEAATKVRLENSPTPEHSQVVYMPWFVNQNQNQNKVSYNKYQ